MVAPRSRALTGLLAGVVAIMTLVTVPAGARNLVGGPALVVRGAPVLRDAQGRALSHPERPAITTTPRQVDATVGATATFLARAVGVPTPHEQWYRESKGAHRFVIVRGATGARLLVPRVTMRGDGSRFRALFTNVAGRVTSTPATLVVTPASIATGTSVGLEPPPAISLNPQDAYVVSGATASFQSTATGTPAPSVAWWYSTDGGVTYAPTGLTEAVLSVVATTSMNGWRYEAIFTNSAGTVTSASATLSVGVSQATSQTWAGYVTTRANFTHVTGTFVVAASYCTSATTNSLTWVGIDGWGSPTVEQDGVSANCSGGVAHYGAWYEMYGDTSPQCNCFTMVPLGSNYPVVPGDTVTASVDFVGGQWVMGITDITENWGFSVTLAAPTPTPWQTSAEWVFERPTMCSDAWCTGGTIDTLTPCGPVIFTNAQTGTATRTGTIADFPAAELTMLDGTTPLVAPGPLGSGGASFSVG